MGNNAQRCVIRAWSGRAGLIGSILLGSLGWAANASAAPRADYDLDDDGLIEINDLGDLNEIRNNAFGSSLYGSSSGCPATGCFGFSLTADLNFDTSGNGTVGPEDAYFTENVGWVPLPYLSAFFDGGGHTIRNLTVIGTANDEPVGLFSRLSAGVVHDLRLQDASFVNFISRTGVLAGEALDSSVERVSVVGGSVFINNLAEIGGLIGNCEWTEVKESYTSLDVRASNSVGGLVGRGSSCHVSRSFVLGRTTSDRYGMNIGGVMGEMIDGSIVDSFVSGSVGEGPFFGGLVGQTTGTPIITNTYVSGAVVGSGAAGGAMLGFGPATFASSFYATDTTGFTKTKTAGGGAVGLTLANLKCSDAPSDPDCPAGLFAGWENSLNSDGQPAWDFGNNQQVPALRIQGVVYRDSDGDGLLDAEDEFPSVWAASLDSDNDGAVDFWREGCAEQCIATSGLVLDQFPSNAAAALDLDLDGRPDSWNPACNSTCQAASGLTLDARPDDFDNDGISDATDQDDDGNGLPDVDLDSDNLIDISTHEELALIHNDPTGISLRRTDYLPEFGSVADASGCRPRIVGPIMTVGLGEFVIRNRVLARHCEGYELLNDLDLDTNGDDVINENDAYWNEGRGWDSLGHFGDDPRVAFQATFEGNGHTISNVFVAQDPTNEGGLFGGVRGGSIRNLGIIGDLSSVTSDAWLGTLVAQITSSTVSNCYSTAPAFSEGGFYSGGLVGLVESAIITGSFATGDLLATEGFCSEANCDAHGGLVGGLRYDSTVTASFASGSVFGTNGSAGGLVGEVDTGSMVFGSFSTTLVQATSTPPGQIGGLIGRAGEDVAIASYWATDASTQNFSAGNAEGGTLSQLQCPAGPDNTTCLPGVTLYDDWGTYLDENDLPYWEFGTASELPGLCLGGSLYRVDSSGELLPLTPCHCTQSQQELVTNRGFETNTAGWVGSFGTTISSSTLQAHSGARSLRVTNRNTGAWQGAEYNLLGTAVPGETLSASVWTRISGDPSEPVKFTLRSVCQGAPTVYTQVAAGTATNTGWVQISGTVQIPSCTLTQLVMYAEGPRTTVDLFIDDVSITRTSQVCQGEEAPLGGSFIVTSSWNTGYCVELRLTNPLAAPTTDWSATFNLNGTTINQIWNMGATSLTGSPTVTPGEAWAQVIPANGSSHSLGFCATRPSGSNALPTGIVATGAF